MGGSTGYNAVVCAAQHVIRVASHRRRDQLADQAAV